MNFLMGVVPYLVEPVGEVLEWSLACDIEHEDGCDWSFVVGPGDRFEWLLASSIPNLHFYGFFVSGEHFWAELDPEGGLMLAFEPAFEQAHEDTGFADICIEEELLLSPISINLNR